MMHIHHTPPPPPQPLTPPGPDPRKEKVDKLLSFCEKMKKGDKDINLASMVQDVLQRLDEAVREIINQPGPQPTTYDYGAPPPPRGAWVHG